MQKYNLDKVKLLKGVSSVEEETLEEHKQILQKKKLADLYSIARQLNIKSIAKYKKEDLIEKIMELSGNENKRCLSGKKTPRS
jgi:nitrate/nitrite-specific signal transduction histidine kinase